MYAPFRSWSCACAVFLVVGSGCGREGGTIQGKITLDNEPLESGYVSFVPIEGAPGAGMRAQIIKGNYTIDAGSGSHAGVYRVEIYCIRKTGKKIEAGSPAPSGTMIDEEDEAVPKQYNRESTLRQELKPKNNTCNFELTTRAKP